MRYVLAIDAGGSKCDAVLLQEDGTTLGWGHVDVQSPGVTREQLGHGRAAGTVALAIRQAVGDRHLDELYLLGIGAFLPQNCIQHDRLGSVHFSRVLEVEPAYTLMGEKEGLVVVSGTGAFVYGRTRDGKRVHLDGVGPLLGDDGGGYAIGLMGLRKAARSYMHPRHATSLAPALLDALGLSRQHGLEQLTGFMLQAHDRSEIARLAAVVDQQARAGDQIASDILIEAADALAGTTWDAIDHLSIAQEEYPLIGMGSVAVQSDMFWQRFCETVAAFAPRLRFVRMPHPPVFGTALIGLQQLGVTDTVEVRERLINSAYSGKAVHLKNNK